MSGVVSGMVLAAGTSSRLGQQTKQLLPWQDTTMLGWVVRRVEESLLDEVVVVVGHEAEEIRRHVVLQRARFVEAPDFHEGCTSSIRAGLEALHPQSEAVVLILGDQPGMERETIAAVVEGWRHMQAPVVRVSYRGRSGHPMLFTKALFGQLKALHGDKGVWKLCDAHPEWVREIEVDRPFPGDVNTWEDYAKLASPSPA
jgi:molybdenum cofactor cytidylyltransferase